MIRPLRLRHIHVLRQDSRESLVSSCSLALHMSKGETRLLQYYAKQQDGFAPAAKRIIDETGLSRARVFAARGMLEQHGVIKLDEQHIYIDWERVRLFSTLNPEMTSKHCTVAPVRLKKRDYKVYISKELRNRLSFLPVPELCDLLAAMTEEEYRAACAYLREKTRL